MDEGTVSGGLVWATPVRPDLLGLHLEAYDKALPVLNALRLCQRFGKGPNANITKLPSELVLLIEDFIIDQEIEEVTTPWLRSFLHFEYRCAPSDHMRERYWSLFMQALEEEDLQKDICDDCQKDFVRIECEKGCVAQVEVQMNFGIIERGEFPFDKCQAERDAWSDLIRQGPNGDFAKYDKLLRKHFGLQAYFATTRAPANSLKWPDHHNHGWHEGTDTLETTICYLHLPSQMSRDVRYTMEDYELDVGFGINSGCQSFFVDLPTERDRKNRVDHFNKVLRILRLKPYVHPSQLNGKVSAEATFLEDSKIGSSSKDQENAEDKYDDQAKQQQMAKVEWPQLVMLLKTVFELG